MATSKRSVGLTLSGLVLAFAGIASPALSADVLFSPGVTPTAPASQPSVIPPALGAPASGAPTSGTPVSQFRPVPAVTAAPAPADPATTDAELLCVAKVVHHEAANQSHDGQLAVAQVIVNRTRAGGFARSLCGVVRQPGQFFDDAAYSPPADGRWRSALAVASEVLDANEDQQVVPGALFFRAASARPTAFMRRRQQLATVGGHVFYR